MSFEFNAPIESPLVLPHVILWIIHIIFSILILFYIFYRLYIRKEIKKESEERLNIMNIITWFFYILFMCISNICTISFQFLGNDEILAKIIERIAVIFIYIAIFVKVVYLEHIVKKMKVYNYNYISIFSLITIIMFMFIDPADFKGPGNFQLFLIIWVFILYFFLPGLYLYLAIKTTGEFRKKALEALFGVSFLAFGLLFQPLNLAPHRGDLELLNILIELAYIISPITILIGLTLLFTSQLIIPREKSSPKKLPNNKDKFEVTQTSLIETLYKSKPVKITEEEVSISKEKKICLVCKIKLSGFNIFLCSNCETFYCEKCARSLSNLENVCWVCDAPFDESKPINLTEKPKEEIIVEEVIKKKEDLLETSKTFS